MQAAVVAETQQLFTRYRDGARPVRLIKDAAGARSWEVTQDGGPPLSYTTPTELMVDITGHPKGRGWSPERYFGLGTYAKTPPPGQANIFDLFAPVAKPISYESPLALADLTVPGTKAGRSKTLLGRATLFDLFVPLSKPHLRISTNLTVPRTRRRGRRRRLSVVEVSGPLGIDLVNRSDEVAKLLYACFGRRISSAGYEGEDVLQEVYRGLLARNKGKCPWDPAKSSFGHYVYMVCSCVLSNYHRKQKRRRQFEQTGMLGYQDTGGYGYIDVAANATLPAVPTDLWNDMLLEEAEDALVDYLFRTSRGHRLEARLAALVLPYVRHGAARATVAAELGLSMAAVSRAISYLRRQTRAWEASLA